MDYMLKIRRRFSLGKREHARALVKRKILHFNLAYQFKINRVAIKNAKTRWGSCSSKGNLNFNYKIIYLPEELVDYIIVHELCHLKEFNHSKAFWALVAQVIPNFKALNKKLKSLPINGF